MSCRACGYVERCELCDLSMTYHKGRDELICHYCGSTRPVPEICPSCGSRSIRYFGGGTQKVQEEMERLFPEVKTLRMDADTTSGKEGHLKLYEAFRDQQAQVPMCIRDRDRALDQLVEMRRAEGEKMRADIEEKLKALEDKRAEVAVRAPVVEEEYRARLSARLEELLGDVALDEGRLANEVALFSDRCSIAEELARLNSHIEQTRAMLAADEPVGRKLDFMMQEFNREVNTICSKANDLAITNAGLTMKNEIEKMREQVQNIE